MLDAALNFLISMARIERDILCHLLVGIQIKVRVAQPAAFSLCVLHKPAADSFTLPRRPHSDVIEKHAAVFFDENEDANNLLAAIDDKHAVIADDLVVVPQHGSRRLADALDVGRVSRSHALRNAGRIAGESAERSTRLVSGSGITRLNFDDSGYSILTTTFRS